MLMARLVRLVSGIVGIGLAGALSLGGPVAAQSPDSLTETYSAWTVRCAAAQDAGRRCVMVQALQRENGGERLLLAELVIAGGNTTLSMLTPFGLAVSQGARLQVDENEALEVPFFTCLPRGCVLRHTLSEDAIAAMRRGATLKTRFTVAQAGEPFELGVSLNGFSAAYRRLSELAGD